MNKGTSRRNLDLLTNRDQSWGPPNQAGLTLLLIVGWLTLLPFNSWANPTVPSAPTWDVPVVLESDTGYGRLEWMIDPGQYYEMFRIEEKTDGPWQTSYIHGLSMNIFRGVPDSYKFRLSACVRDDQGTPHCGDKTEILQFEVSDAIYHPIIEAGPQPIPPVAPLGSQTPAGGPSALRPGLWHNEDKWGMGWSFYWKNRLSSASSPQNEYDLEGVWYTFEPKRVLEVGGCGDLDAFNEECEFRYSHYLPTVMTATLTEHHSNPNVFDGQLWTYHDGVAYQFGYVQVTFDSVDNGSASIWWYGTFEIGLFLSDTETVELLAGDNAPHLIPTDLAGLWDPSSGGEYFIADNLGRFSEAVDVIFFDDEGDLTWIQAESQGAPQPGTKDLCFYYVNGGYPPDKTRAETLSWLTPSQDEESECDFSDPDQVPIDQNNRNGTRRFTSYEDAEYWVDFVLPPRLNNDDITINGSVHIGAAGSPVGFSKTANFHRVQITSGSGCSIGPSVPACTADVTWFTDGAFPNVTVFAYDQISGDRHPVIVQPDPPASSVYAGVNDTAEFDQGGTYILELHISDDPDSRVIAKSSTFTVEEEFSVTSPTTPDITWFDEQEQNYKVSWGHSDPTAVDHFLLQREVPSSPVSIEEIAVLPGPNGDTEWLSGPVSSPLGTYRHRVKACATASSTEECSSYTSWVSWTVNGTPDPEIQRPWADNSNQSSLVTDVCCNYSAGYHFKPLVDGRIEVLGGLFSGTFTVKLVQRGDDQILAEASVSSSNGWSWAQLDQPVQVQGNVEYTVFVGFDTGGTIAQFVDPTVTYGDIDLIASTIVNNHGNLDLIPNDERTGAMYGQVDIGFVSTGEPLQPPVIAPIPDREDDEGEQISFTVQASDPDGEIISYSDSDTLPDGLSITDAGLVSGTIQVGASLDSPYAVEISVVDDDELDTEETFTWTVSEPPPGECTELFSDTFEPGQGGTWTRNLQNTDTATGGLWEQANADDTFYDKMPFQLGTAPSEVNSLVTNAAGGDAYGSDVDGGLTSISSPEIFLPAGAGEYEVEFIYNFAYIPNMNAADRFALLVVTDSGEEEVAFERFTDLSTSPGSWNYQAVDLSEWAGETIRLKFIADDRLAGNLVEAQVDNVSVCSSSGSSNTAPVVEQPGPQTSYTGTQIDPLEIEVYDAEGQPVTCSISGLPANLSESSECAITGTVNDAPGDYTVSVVANDGQLDSDEVDFNWHVIAPGDPNPDDPPEEPVQEGDVNWDVDDESSRVGATTGAFRVDGSGSATYSIPILTAPGSGGMTPQISLDYSSQVGNTTLGLGWSVGGLSAITRCGQTLAQDGPDAVRGVSLTENDRFCLDGERLILVSGTYGENGAVYRPERDPITKVVSYKSPEFSGSGPETFTVWRKDGFVSEYGNESQVESSSNARIEAHAIGGDENTALLWAVNRISDPASNYIDFKYSYSSGGEGEPVEYVISKILYTGNAIEETTPYAELEFVYDFNPRPDATQVAVAGSRIAQTQLLRRMYSRAKATETSDSETLRVYRLDYIGDEYGRRILQTVTECWDDQSLDHCYPPAKFGWHTSRHEIHASTAQEVSLANVISANKHEEIALADVNGDGRPDLLVSEKQGSNFYFKTALALPGGGFASPSTQEYPIPEVSNEDRPVRLYAIDLNADGYQDVIYPTSTGWKGRLSTGAGLDPNNELTVADCCNLPSPSFVRIMDVDGDGLADLVTDRTGGELGREMVFLRNKFSPPVGPNEEYGFEQESRMFVRTGEDFFPDEVLPYHRTNHAVRFHDWGISLSDRHTRTFDYNGDGAADALVRLTAFYCHESDQGCPPAPNASDGTIGEFEFGAGDAGEPPASFPVYTAEFHVVLVSSKCDNPLHCDYEFRLQNVAAVGTKCNVQNPLCDDYDTNVDIPKDVEHFYATDVNADGLGDFAFRIQDDSSRSDAGYWSVLLNAGGAFKSPFIPVAEQDSVDIANRSFFQDVDGDGFADFLYPSSLTEGSELRIHYNLYGTSFVQSFSPTGIQLGNPSELDSSVLVDFTGDGILDNLLIDRGGNGEVLPNTSRVYIGYNAVQGEEYAFTLMDYVSTGVDPAPSNPDVESTETLITYLPQTNSTVYTRLSNSSNADWSLGQAVYDIVSPSPVVSEVATSTPTFFAQNDVGVIRYHYVGAKVQGGGRGYLGFGEVITYDAQTGIRTNTRYRQDFPFTGMPVETSRFLPSSSRALAPISEVSESSPPEWSTVDVTASTSLPASFLNFDRILSYSINELGKTETVAGKGTWHAYVSESLNRMYILGDLTLQTPETPSERFDKKVFSSSDYNNPYGNLEEVEKQTFDSDVGGALPYAEQITINGYADEDPVAWHLGRITSSVITHDRVDAPPIERRTSYVYDERGLLDLEIVEPNKARLRVTTDYSLDNFGNRTTTTVTGYEPDGLQFVEMVPRQTSHQYDLDYGRFIVKTTNAVGQVVFEATQWDAFGNILRAQDLNGVETVTAADSMGRPFVTYTQNGTWTRTIHGVGAGSVCPTSPAGRTAHHTYTTSGGAPASVKCFDILGREIRSATQGFTGSWIKVDSYFDSSGRSERVSEPYFSGTPPWNRAFYDVLDRIVMVDSADGNDVLNAWDSNASFDGHGCGTPTPGAAPRFLRITNGLGQERLEERNALGDTVRVFDEYCESSTYEYDAQGYMTEVRGVDDAMTLNTYDEAGRKMSLTDDDSGYREYKYNSLGELVRQRDGLSQAIDFVYDELGRVTHRRELSDVSTLEDESYETENHEVTTWNDNNLPGVNGKGQIEVLSYKVNENGAILDQRDFTYDDYGREISVDIYNDGLTLTESTTYDEYSRIFQKFDVTGDSRGIRYHYDEDFGYLVMMQEAREGSSGPFQGARYQTVVAMDQRLNVTQMSLENGVDVYAFHEDDSGRLESQVAFSSDNELLQSITYYWDDLGNLEHRVDDTPGRSMHESYSYDNLNRLTSVHLPPVGDGPTQTLLSLSYDPNGNLKYKSDVGNYVYNEVDGGPHAVTSAGGVEYKYDDNGNQWWSSDGREIDYTVFNKPTLIERTNAQGTDSTEFTYGIRNSRVKREDSNDVDGDKTTWYFENAERIQKLGDAYFKRYIGGVAIGEVDTSGGPQQTSYLVRDHLGGIYNIADESGREQTSQGLSFSPLGSRRQVGDTDPLGTTGMATLNDATTRGFTGHEHVDGLGIVHMNGRIYEPRLGRFLQADPMVQAPKNSQSLNRYTYVYNNPLSYTDPTGYFSLGGAFQTLRNLGKSLFKLVHFDLVASYEFTMTNRYANAVAGVVAAAFTPWCGGCGAALHAAATAQYHGGEIDDVIKAGGTAWALAAAGGQYGTGGNIDYTRLVTDVAVAGVAVENQNVAAGLGWFAHGYRNWESFGDFAQDAYGGASKYYVSRKIEDAAASLGLTLNELNAYLFVNSFLGRSLTGTSVYGEGNNWAIFGWRGRSEHGNWGLIWDVNDIILGYQGLLDAVSYDFIGRAAGNYIQTGHSLGAIRSNNLVARGFASGATLFSLPVGNVSSSATRVLNGWFDPVSGSILGLITNPWATPTPCDSLATACHGFAETYEQYRNR